jgi:hypothetical protein
VAARFFPPQVAGAGATVGTTGLPFRIDHDEKFNQPTHIQYELLGGHILAVDLQTRRELFPLVEIGAHGSILREIGTDAVAIEV